MPEALAPPQIASSGKDFFYLSRSLAYRLRSAGEGTIKTPDQDIAEGEYLQRLARVKGGKLDMRGHLDVNVTDPDKLWLAANILYSQKEAASAYFIIRAAQITALGGRVPAGWDYRKIHEEVMKYPQLLNRFNGQQILVGTGACLKLLEQQLIALHRRKSAFGQSRRHFLQTAGVLGMGALGAGALFKWPIPTIPAELQTSQEPQVVIAGSGSLSGEATARPSVSPGVTESAKLVVASTARDTPVARVIVPEPTQINRVEKKEAPPKSRRIGIRNNVAGLMPLVDRLHIQMVRIAGNGNDPLHDPDLRKALEVAKKQNLKILYVFNPPTFLPAGEIRNQLKNLFNILGNTELVLELGNEPDNKDWPFWKDRNLDTFAQFVKAASEEARNLRPNIKLVIGALVDPGLTGQLMVFLEKRKANTKDMLLGVHAYNEPEDIDKRVKQIRGVTNMPLIATEVGSYGNARQALPELITRVLQYTDRVYIHELPDPADQKMGFGDPETGEPNEHFYTLEHWMKTYVQSENNTVARPG